MRRSGGGLAQAGGGLLLEAEGPGGEGGEGGEGLCCAGGALVDRWGQLKALGLGARVLGAALWRVGRRRLCGVLIFSMPAGTAALRRAM
eukprot:SAG31_NODE_9815_length_1223_cov_3.746441_1_plen_89_part_00